MEAVPVTYQLFIRVDAPLTVQVGRLGRFHFPAGEYVYTGSAKRGLNARILRHRKKRKPKRWHIDYLTTAPGVSITHVSQSAAPECELNARTHGTIPAPGFGASDCKAGCGSHLKLLGL
ncbi:MAG: DUF123 domain-containing protein [Leptospirillia bacterium]